MAERKLAPRLVSKTEAAHYCGLNVQSFGNLCPVPSISLGRGAGFMRYDVQALDKWIDGLGQPTDIGPDDLLQQIG